MTTPPVPVLTGLAFVLLWVQAAVLGLLMVVLVAVLVDFLTSARDSGEVGMILTNAGLVGALPMLNFLGWHCPCGGSGPDEREPGCPS